MNLQRRLPWCDFPLAIGAAFLFAGSVLLILQLVIGAIRPGKQMKLCAALIGMEQKPEPVPFSMPNVLSGAYQAALARQIGTHEPYYPTAVRVRNQLEFSLFGVSPMPRMVLGTGGQLLQIEYINDYCTRNLAAFLPTAPAWAAKIRQMQDKVESRGQNFLYVITPSKVAMYPDDLPAGMPCYSTQADRTQLVPAWTALVRQQGVNLVDTTSLLRAAAPYYPFRMFPKGGTHWNQVGSALGAQAVEAALQAQRRDELFKPFTFTWQMSAHPKGMDTDLATLMNLFWLPAHSDVPDVTFHEPAAAPGCRRLRITIVGGSFMESVGAALARLPCGADVVEYFYWKIDRLSWDKNGVMALVPVDPAVRDAELRDADVILYEENEAVLGHSNHGVAFYNWLQGETAKPGP